MNVSECYLGSPGISVSSESVFSTPESFNYFLSPSAQLPLLKVISPFEENWDKC